MSEHFDLAVIGTGSGNSIITEDFADKRVAVIEANLFGGTCLNVGCIPTKMFVYTAEVAEAARNADRYGVTASVDNVRWTEIRDRIFTRIDAIEAGGREYRVNGPGTTAYLGRARFTGARSLRVDLNDGGKADLTADEIVVATGAHAHIPEVIRESGVPFHTSDTIMRIDELPERLVIVGGGYIAMEMAHVFAGLGVAVTVLSRGPQLLRHLDETVADRFTELAVNRWDVRLSTHIVALAETDGITTLELSDGQSIALTSTDVLLVATGRHANTDDLGLDEAGVERHLDGRIVVDEFGRTTADGIWSLGDACSPSQLKHVANHEARCVAHNLVHPEDLRSFDLGAIPAGVFTEPQIATVGLTEAQCRAKGLTFVTKTQQYGDTAYGWAMEDSTSFAKLIADPDTGRILGAHLMGPQSTSLIQVLTQAMAFGQHAHEVARGQYWIHPALAEVVENALLGLPLH